MKSASEQTAFYHQLGENIRAHRKRRNFSQDRLAKMLGLTRTSLTNIENGNQHPPIHTLCEIGERLQVDITALLPRGAANAVAVNAAEIASMAGSQVRGAAELAFITAGLGIDKRESHGDPETKDSSAR